METHHSFQDGATRPASQPYEVNPSISNPSILFFRASLNSFLLFTYTKKKNANPAHIADAAKISVLFKRFLIVMCNFASLSLG